MSEFMWPDFVTSPEHDFGKSTRENRLDAIAAGLVAWANCMAGADVPKDFGHAMVRLGEFLKISPATESNLKAEADRLMEKRS